VDADGKESSDDYEILRLSKQHNDANMLSIAARFVSQDEIEKAVGIWLDEPFSDAERHVRRIKKLDR
jgi:ribose 5-phosphate isomerase B